MQCKCLHIFNPHFAAGNTISSQTHLVPVSWSGGLHNQTKGTWNRSGSNAMHHRTGGANGVGAIHLENLGCISLGKILIRILNPKPDFLFLWQNQKRDYESNESVHDEDSMD